MRLKTVLCLGLLLTGYLSVAQTKTNVLQFHNPAGVAPPNGYSHVVQVDLGTTTMLLISGQVALDAQGNLVGRNDLSKQTEQVFRNIKQLVETSGGTMQQVAKLSYFMLDISQIQAVRDVRNRYLNMAAPPASTAVQVSKLFRDDLLIEIEATVIIPKK